MHVIGIEPHSLSEADWQEFHTFWRLQYMQSGNPREMDSVDFLRQSWTDVSEDRRMHRLIFKSEGRIVAAMRAWSEAESSPYHAVRKEFFWAELAALKPAILDEALTLWLGSILLQFRASGCSTYQLLLNDDALRNPILSAFPFEEVSRSAEYVQSLDHIPALANEADTLRFEMLNLDRDEDIERFAALYREVHADVPWQNMQVARLPYDRAYFLRFRDELRRKRDQDLFAFGAFDGDEMLALHSAVCKRNEPRILEVDFTGVKGPARGRKLGVLLKAFAARCMNERFPSLRYALTATNSSNQAMQKVNQSLGYKPCVNYSVLRYCGL